MQNESRQQVTRQHFFVASGGKNIFSPWRAVRGVYANGRLLVVSVHNVLKKAGLFELLKPAVETIKQDGGAFAYGP